MPGRFKDPIKIKEAINHIDDNNWYLPAFQREFRWNEKQINALFDSIMKKLPIGSFLFWQVPQNYIDKRDNYPFFEFCKELSKEEIILHPQATINENKKKVISVLDGQQRISALYIGLKGGYKINTHLKKYLHSNLLCTENNSTKGRFKFISEDEANKESEKNYRKISWYPMRNILKNVSDDWKKALKEEKKTLKKELISKGFDPENKEDKQEIKRAQDNLDNLYKCIHREAPIMYYLVDKKVDFTSAAKIFIQTNSSGKALEKWDILLSTAVATWENKNVREQVDVFRRKLNNDMGDRFNFRMNFILKAWLTLFSESSSVKFDLNNYTTENMREIEKKWKNIQDALEGTVRLIANYNYSKRTLTSKNAILPIAYYLIFNNKPKKYLISNDRRQEAQNAINWLRKVLVKKLFDHATDATLQKAKDFITACGKGPFPYKRYMDPSQYEKEYREHLGDLNVSDEDIKKWSDIKYGDDRCFSVLSLLHPEDKLSGDVELDHIFPRNLPKLIDLKKEGIEYFEDHQHDIANLQPLTSSKNGKKGTSMPDEWVKTEFNDDPKKIKEYLEKLIGKDDLSLLSLPKLKTFFIERRAFIEGKLKKELLPPERSS